jgi:hypothetical protein
MGLFPSIAGFRSTPVLLCLLGAAAIGQTTHRAQVCDLSDCYFIDTSIMGGLRFEDYRVTNPKAIQFDPARRSVELALLGSSIAQTMCQAPLGFVTPAPTITFNNVQAHIRYTVANGATPDQQFLDVEFADSSASNGCTSPSFGLKMTRAVSQDGLVDNKFRVELHAGNAGLQNVVGLVDAVGYTIDPINPGAYFYGTVSSSLMLRQAVFGVLANVYSILKVGTFSTTGPPPGRADTLDRGRDRFTGSAGAAADRGRARYPSAARCNTT